MSPNAVELCLQSVGHSLVLVLVAGLLPEYSASFGLTFLELGE